MDEVTLGFIQFFQQNASLWVELNSIN